ncbi:hypothetical protein [Erythrobacter sp. BLCC-B19]|uniref:hypothetical protein n=1 Tax=Erythrobacter sp. BLCC-B19 TaxID=3025315 RepID=UPI0023628459|nr:hypothetical protein [Erythrobacter sp. BLCC-B19]WDA42710.1 hypothetical protein PS060_07855 [Erythrobacter sp. BLCC-B19]
MKMIAKFALVAAGSLALAACGGKKEEAPAAEPTAAEPEMMAPADAATPAEEELDPTGNPIGMGAPAADATAAAAE